MKYIINDTLELKVYGNITPHIRGFQVHFVALVYFTAFMPFKRTKQ